MILSGTRKYEGLLQGYYGDPQTRQHLLVGWEEPLKFYLSQVRIFVFYLGSWLPSGNLTL